MILIDYEGEILCDIAEIAFDRMPRKLTRELVSRGWTSEQVGEGLRRAFGVPTNRYPKGRLSPIPDLRPWWRRWWRHFNGIEGR